MASVVRLLPLIFLLCATILTNGWLMSKLGYSMPWYAIGAALVLIANVCLCKSYKLNPNIEYTTYNQPARIDNHTSTYNICGFEALLGICGGAFVQAAYAVIQAVVAPEDLGYAVSFMMIGMYNHNYPFLQPTTIKKKKNQTTNLSSTNRRHRARPSHLQRHLRQQRHTPTPRPIDPVSRRISCRLRFRERVVGCCEICRLSCGRGCWV